jgi:hypothetical protein
LPAALAVPTVVPPVVQVVGAEAWGPNTLYVIVPVGLAPPAREALTDEAAMAVLATSVAGPAVDRVGLAFATTVLAMVEPHVLVDAVLLVSPP